MCRVQDRAPAGRTHTVRTVSCGRAAGTLARAVLGLGLAGALVVLGGRGSAGHQIGHYPSYYPDEIRIDVVDPAAAGRDLEAGTLHAYVGAAPQFAGPAPEHAKPVTSLGSFVVVTIDAAAAETRCAAARRLAAALAGESAEGFVFHPYPVTPYHPDYLHHLDRVEAARAAVADTSAGPVRVGARGPLAHALVRARASAAAHGPDAVLETVPALALIASAGFQLDGRWAAPWAKEGWFHAYRLLSPAISGDARREADEIFASLVRGHARSLAEHVDLERRLVLALTRSCARMVLGYVPRRELYDDRYPDGVENVAYDSQSGLNSAVFLRTVKLKDYPWNGKLRLGVPDRPLAAWNPVAGFGDPAGRLLWSAVGDPAMIPFPFNASWMPNRVQADVKAVQGQSGGIKVPADALVPEPGTGKLQPAGEWAFASAKVVYDVLASPFEDGSEQDLADLLYPLSFLYRWGGETAAGAHEPRLRHVLSALQDRLAGIKLVRVDRTKHAVAEGLEIVTKTPVLEVYLRQAPGEERQTAALGAPWSTVPWHLLALMEQAVGRGYAAFSEEEAKRRGVPWLDLVRDRALRERLLALAAELEREAYRPEALAALVTPEEARARWRALRAFAERTGHLLVTNGPYRLKSWSEDSIVLEAVRELSYPLGFGTFDRFVNPPRAVIADARLGAGSILVRADAEMVLKMGRRYGAVKEPLSRSTTRGVYGLLVVSRYLLIGPDGKVHEVDKMHWREDGQFEVRLADRLAPGRYTAILGIFLDGNPLQPSVKVLHFDVGDSGTAGAPG